MVPSRIRIPVALALLIAPLALPFAAALPAEFEAEADADFHAHLRALRRVEIRMLVLAWEPPALVEFVLPNLTIDAPVLRFSCCEPVPPPPSFRVHLRACCDAPPAFEPAECACEPVPAAPPARPEPCCPAPGPGEPRPLVRASIRVEVEASHG